MRIQIGRAMGEVRVNGRIYESPNGVHIDGDQITDYATGEPLEPRPEPHGGDER
jgi:hypothetical protein